MGTAAFGPAGAQLPLWSGEAATGNLSVRESRRARRLSMRVSTSGRVEVTAPLRTAPRTIERFLSQHREWIERQREKARRLALPAQPFPPQQLELSACEQTVRIHLAGGKGRIRLTPAATDVLTIAGDVSRPGALREALQAWLMHRAREVLAPMLASVAAETGLHYARLSIRRQRTRWGSCSSRGTISLNCCLLFQRPQVVRYLLIHELAHTLHMNHSPRFWQAVAQLCPDYRRLDRDLLQGWRRVPAWVLER